MNLDDFIQKLTTAPESINFSDTMAVIDIHYDFTPTSFTNGNIINAQNQNNGSCKIFAFGLINNLSEAQTLACFGDYYRQDVLHHPTADDHHNIRHFMQSGWAGIHFESEALTAK